MINPRGQRFTMFLVVGAILAGGVSLRVCSTARRAGEGSSIAAAWSATAHDFGRRAVGASLKCEFVLTNCGSAEFEIADVQGSCGCLASAIKKRTLRPGDSSRIEVELATLGYRAPERLDKTLTVTLRQEETRELTALELSAQLEPEVFASPPEIVFDEAQGNDQPRQTLCIERRMLSREAFAALEVRSSSTSCTVAATSRDEDRIELDVILRGDGLIPTYLGPLEIAYDKDAKQQRQYVPLRLSAPRVATATSPKWYFCRVPRHTDGATLESSTLQWVELRPPGKGGAVIRDVVASGDAQGVLQWRIDPQDPSRLAVWVQQLPDEARVVRGKLAIAIAENRSSASATGQLTLPVYLVIEAPSDGRLVSQVADAS